MIYLLLFLEFFKIGLFSVGGGLATLPFFYDLCDKYNWFAKERLIDMIAISESTPGPIGINMSTYIGFETGGVLGGTVATFGIVLPSYIIIVIIARVLTKFRDNKYVDNCFYVIKPAVVALILTSCIEIYKTTLFNINPHYNLSSINYKNTILFIIFLTFIIKFNKHPIFYIIIAGIIGFIFKL